MTAAERAALRSAIDAARREQLKRRPQVTTCDNCGVDLAMTPNPRKRFCSRTCNNEFHRARRAPSPNPRVVYATEEERRAARREAWRQHGLKKRRQYDELVERFGVEKQWRRWTSHLAELRRAAA